ncbi:MAG: TIGR00266 family protein [Spirochaetota bacterium]
MDFIIHYKPSYAIADVTLKAGEQVLAESGAMMSFSPAISIQTHRAQKGKGVLRSLKTSFLGGESFWMNTFTAASADGTVTLAPTLPGDISHVDCNGTLYVQSTSFLAGSTELEMDTSFQGMKGFFSGESLFFLKISGQGPLLLSSYGGIEEIQVKDSLVVDTGHIVAFDDSLEYTIKKFGGWKSFLLGGEGLVCNFRGSGRVWIQSRNMASLSAWLTAKLPPRKQ